MSSSSAKSTTARRGLPRMKHTQLRLLGVQDLVQQRPLTVGKVTSDENRSDILTKPTRLFKDTANLDDEWACVVCPFDAA